jgi:Zn-dependent peptidase ImmA (M78 family)
MKRSPSAIHFEFAPAEDAARRNDGWGVGMLAVCGQPYWFAGSETEPKTFEWTWVDFLEHLADVWGALVSEESYPFAWLQNVRHPGEIWKAAERRWAALGEVVAAEEEPRLLAFDRRHNLSAGWMGIGLPALTWLRTGETLWLCPEAGEPIRASYNACREALLTMGDCLAAAYAASTNPRVASAVGAWRTRDERFRSQFLELATGLTREELMFMQEGQDASAYWGVAANSNWDSGEVAGGELLAAARMTAGLLDVAIIQRLLRSLRRLKPRQCPTLDALSARALKYVAGKRPRFAFEAGYHAADFLKGAYADAGRKYVDISTLLQGFGVELVDLEFGTDKIDAIAVWGSRGPAVVMNLSRSYGNDANRTRMTLAHELCHLLLDREGGLPFCEVLGGKVDDFVERRAKAFAAELLLPRASVVHEWSMWRGNFAEFQLKVSQTYGVSKSVICAQVHNSVVFEKLDPHARDYVLRRLRDFEGQDASEPVETIDVV